jgi:hypothetical protein
MDSMTPHAKQILERYRELESLDGDARLRVTRALERRIANGEPSLPGIDVDPPTLPGAQSAFSLAAGNVAGKVVVAVVFAAASAAFLWRGWVGEPAPSAPQTPLVFSSLPPAQQQPLAATKADRPAQSLPALQPPTAIERVAGKEPFLKSGVHPKPRSQGRSRQKAAISPSEATATHTGLPEITDRFDRVVSELTTVSKETEKGETATIENKAEVTELEKEADQTRSDLVAPPPPPPRQDRPGTLDEEMKLLRAAHFALKAGKPEQALTLLAEHTWRFPNGELVESRDVTRIMALCRVGKAEASRSEAKRFLAERPSSPFAGRVRAICVEHTKTSP